MHEISNVYQMFPNVVKVDSILRNSLKRFPLVLGERDRVPASRAKQRVAVEAD